MYNQKMVRKQNSKTSSRKDIDASESSSEDEMPIGRTIKKGKGRGMPSYDSEDSFEEDRERERRRRLKRTSSKREDSSKPVRKSSTRKNRGELSSGEKSGGSVKRERSQRREKPKKPLIEFD